MAARARPALPMDSAGVRGARLGGPVDLVPPLLIGLLTVYGVACGVAGAEPDAPLWLRWPLPVWNLIAYDWRCPPAASKRPDYAKIDRLERELGLTDSPVEELPPFEQGMRRAGVQERPMRHGALCLTKNCMGDTNEIRTWSGVLLTRVHTCAAP